MLIIIYRVSIYKISIPGNLFCINSFPMSKNGLCFNIKNLNMFVVMKSILKALPFYAKMYSWVFANNLKKNLIKIESCT